jgi:hypothetical protein
VIVDRLVGVYDADGSIRGELTYFIGARLGRSHCALCDITHGRVRERADWKACRSALPVPVELFHRDDQPTAARTAAGTDPPYVLAGSGAELVLLLDAAAIERCDGDLDAFTDALDAAVLHRGLAWPPG